MIRSNQAGQAKNRPPRREEGENGNLQRFPFDTEVESNTIEVHVSRLRKKLDKGTIETVRGMGYRLGGAA